MGVLFRVTTWGESHGPATGAVVDGCPANLPLSADDVQRELDRRRPGHSRITSQRHETDEVQILSGVFEGKTLGTPISLMVVNSDVDSSAYEEIKDLVRPGHADLTYLQRYGRRDYRGGGRASGRETVGRVAAGAIAKALLQTMNIEVTGHVIELGGVKATESSFADIKKNADSNPVRCADSAAAVSMEKAITTAKNVGAHVQGTISYTISPVHTVEKYVDFAKELADLECDSICIKDMAGLLAPHEAYELISSLKKEVGLPVALHCHCTSGMAPMSYMAACDAGVDILDTALSPLAGGTSQPPTESVVAALKDTEYDTGYDLKSLMEIRRYFIEVWNKYRHLHRINALKVDPEVTVHQIPGGMLSNLIFQLEEQGAGDKYFDVKPKEWGRFSKFDIKKSKRRPGVCPDVIDKAIIQSFIASDATGDRVAVK